MGFFLSNIIFTDQDDIVPLSGVEQILNTGIVNTLAGNDRITGEGTAYGFVNFGTLNTDDGNDTITGIGNPAYSQGVGINTGRLNTGKGDDVITGEGFSHGIRTDSGSIFDTGEGNDTIRGNGHKLSPYFTHGISNYSSTINTGNGNDMIEGNGSNGIFNSGIINTGNGKDIITANGINIDDNYAFVGIDNSGIINTGNDDDIITSTSDPYDNGRRSSPGISNRGTIDTSDGQDSIISNGLFTNRGNVFSGEGNDSLTASLIAGVGVPHTAIENFNAIDTGNGDDIITSIGTIHNEGIINTGNGNDSIIVERGDDHPDTTPSIYNGGGAINMGDGNDSIIAHDFVYSGFNNSGAYFLGEGDDYIKGYGSGDFYGGNGNDTLELTPGIYTIEIWGEGGESPIFSRNTIGFKGFMITSEFEKLKVGDTIYDFTSLKAGQIITVP